MKKRQKFSNLIYCLICCSMIANLFGFSVMSQAASDQDSFDDVLEQFPKSYHTALKNLHEKYPNWQFEALETGLKWADVLEAEHADNKNVIPLDSNEILKSKAPGDYNSETNTYIQKDSGWVKASMIAVAYFMDPRNFLDEKYIFQFEKLSYDAEQTAKGVEAVLKDTFMEDTNIVYYDTKGKKVKTKEKYSEVIMEAAKEADISAYYIASKIRQEIGAQPSNSVSGKYEGYEGYYNFYNIGATDGEGAIKRGLEWAKTGTTYGRPWNSPKKAIIGGAKYIASSYISCGQNTGYLQKFNVNPNGKYSLYSHQYMTNISGATSEAQLAYKAYAGMNILSEKKKFLIPVYKGITAKGKTVEFKLSSKKGRIIESGINVRKGAGNSFESLGFTVNEGQNVEIIKKIRNKATHSASFFEYPYWYKVSFELNGDLKKGFIAEKFILPEQMLKKEVGESFEPKYVVKNKEGKESKAKVYFDSSDARVATVATDGTVIAVKSGTTVIRVLLDNGKMDSFTLKVVTPEPTPIPGATFDPELITPKPTPTVKPTQSPTPTPTPTAQGGKGFQKIRPVVVSIKATKKKRVSLIWKKVQEASHYRVLRSNKKKKGYTRIAQVKSAKVWVEKKKHNVYVDSRIKRGKKYYYKVIAYKKTKNGKFIYSKASKVMKIKIKK